MAKIDTQFMTKTAEKPYPLGPHILAQSWQNQVNDIWWQANACKIAISLPFMERDFGF